MSLGDTENTKMRLSSGKNIFQFDSEYNEPDESATRVNEIRKRRHNYD